MIKPTKLNRGDTVALLSMSWGGPSVFPHTYEAGKFFLENNLGLKAKEYWSTRAPADELAKNPAKRAVDIMSAFVALSPIAQNRSKHRLRKMIPFSNRVRVCFFVSFELFCLLGITSKIF